jgi:hypothetical protein
LSIFLIFVAKLASCLQSININASQIRHGHFHINFQIKFITQSIEKTLRIWWGALETTSSGTPTTKKSSSKTKIV